MRPGGGPPSRPLEPERYTYDSASQLTQVGSESYTYDAAGNLTQAGSDTYGWDHDNRLTSTSARRMPESEARERVAALEAEVRELRVALAKSETERRELLDHMFGRLERKGPGPT